MKRSPIHVLLSAAIVAACGANEVHPEETTRPKR
jgi:hypothetical protein